MKRFTMLLAVPCVLAVTSADALANVCDSEMANKTKYHCMTATQFFGGPRVCRYDWKTDECNASRAYAFVLSVRHKAEPIEVPPPPTFEDKIKEILGK